MKSHLICCDKLWDEKKSEKKLKKSCRIFTDSDMVIAVDYESCGEIKKSWGVKGDKWNAASRENLSRLADTRWDEKTEQFHIFTSSLNSFINHHENILAAENYHELLSRVRRRRNCKGRMMKNDSFNLIYECSSSEWKRFDCASVSALMGKKSSIKYCNKFDVWKMTAIEFSSVRFRYSFTTFKTTEKWNGSCWCIDKSGQFYSS